LGKILIYSLLDSNEFNICNSYSPTYSYEYLSIGLRSLSYWLWGSIII